MTEYGGWINPYVNQATGQMQAPGGWQNPHINQHTGQMQATGGWQNPYINQQTGQMQSTGGWNAPQPIINFPTDTGPSKQFPTNWGKPKLADSVGSFWGALTGKKKKKKKKSKGGAFTRAISEEPKKKTKTDQYTFFNRGGNVMPQAWYQQGRLAPPPTPAAPVGSQYAGGGPLSKLKEAALGKLLTYGLKAGATAAGLGPLASVAFKGGGHVPQYYQTGSAVDPFANVDLNALAAAANAALDQAGLDQHNELRAQHATNPGLFGNTGNFAQQDRSDERASNRQGVLIPGVKGDQSHIAPGHASAGNYQQQSRGNLNYLNEQAANNAAIKEQAAKHSFFNTGGAVHNQGHENHLQTKRTVTPDHGAVDKMLGGASIKMGPLASVKYKKTGGEISHEHEKKFHNPLQAKPSGGDSK